MTKWKKQKKNEANWKNIEKSNQNKNNDSMTNTVKDFEGSICKNCGHKKALHYEFSMVPEGDPIPGPGCKEKDCNCTHFEKNNETEQNKE